MKNLCNRDGCGNEARNKYCSVSCSNKDRIITEKTKNKISNSIKEKYKDPTYKSELHKRKNSSIQKQKNTWIEKLLKEDWNNLSYERKRKRILYEQDYKCNKCGIEKWQDQPIKLEFEHIDGDNTNNKRENCEALCPNCHSLTETWRGHNKSNLGGTNKKVSEKEFIKALKNNKSIRQALISLELAPKGNNYKRARKVIMKYNLN